MVENFISAEDARNQTETTVNPLNEIFSHIKDCAGWGMCQIDHCVQDHDPKVVKNLVETLKSAGYSVKECADEEGKIVELHVSW